MFIIFFRNCQPTGIRHKYMSEKLAQITLQNYASFSLTTDLSLCVFTAPEATVHRIKPVSMLPSASPKCPP